uniref:Large ribosomal subunit protein bL17m n=1 Tax=Globodera rostochiensis TaxID=31243 RepID=A0A914HMV9_GLORO
MSTHRLLPSLPRIKVPIGRRPQRLKTPFMQNPRGHMEVLRKLVNRVFREERCEFKYNRAEECRQYVERLIQLGVYRGPDCEYTAEMFRWWFIEQDLIDKMWSIVVPRFAHYPIDESYTDIYRLPTIRLKTRVNKETVFWSRYSIAVLELKENPFPPMAEMEEMRKTNLLEFVKKELRTH